MSWLGRLFRSRQLERELDKELRYHYERQVGDFTARGVDAGEAERATRLTFGGLEQTKEDCRDARGTRWVTDFLADCRYGMRLLRRSPPFTVAAVASLALGIGANTAIFSLMDQVMLRGLPVLEPERLIQLQKIHPTYGRGSFSYPLFQRFQGELRQFEGILAQASQGRAEISIQGAPETARLELVSESYYSVLGVGAAAGRTFGPETANAPTPVAVISHSFWKRRFGADPAAVGKTFQLNRTVFTIIGVTPPEFFGVVVGSAPEITIPLNMEPAVRNGPSWLDRPGTGWLSVMGRLRPETTLPQAAAEVAGIYAREIAAQASREEREPQKQAALAQRIDLLPAATGLDELRRRFSEPLAILMGITALVVLIACANIANLLLSRAAARRREIGVRLAIGAGPGRIVRQMLTESLLLAVFGGGLALLVAFWLGNGLVTMMSDGPQRMALAVRPDARVLAFAALISLAACFLFGLAPALQATRVRFQPALAEGRSARWRLGKGLVIAQAAIAVLLLVGAGLFGRTLANFYTLDAGFSSNQVHVYSLNAGRAGYRDDRLRDLNERVLAGIGALPGVSSASLMLMLPISGGGWDGAIHVQGHTLRPSEDATSHLNSVGPNCFRTLGTAMLLGREFDERDVPGSPRVVVVNEAFARYYFADQSPIGRSISRGEDPDPYQIVGVVKNVKYRNLRDPAPRTVYFASLQETRGPDWNSFLVRSAAPPASIRAAVASVLERIDRNLRVSQDRSLSEHVSRSILTETMLTVLAGFFAALALLLAAVGVYGVTAFQVARRRKELGIRLALGALPGTIAAMIAGQAARLAAAGGLLGLAGALLLSSMTERLLFGVKPVDPVIYTGAGAMMVVIALVAALLPCRSVARMNPVETLTAD